MLAMLTDFCDICADLMPTEILGEENDAVYPRADGQLMYLKLQDDQKILLFATVSEAAANHLGVTVESRSLLTCGEEVPIHVLRPESGMFSISFTCEEHEFWHIKVMICKIIHAMQMA